jgi:hypothetical protein
MFMDVSDVRQIELHTAAPLVPGPGHPEVKIAIAKPRKYQSPGNDQIPTDLIQAGDEILVSMIHNHINSILNMKELLD